LEGGGRGGDEGGEIWLRNVTTIGKRNNAGIDNSDEGGVPLKDYPHNVQEEWRTPSGSVRVVTVVRQSKTIKRVGCWWWLVGDKFQ
jgi:hypothetical protein